MALPMAKKRLLSEARAKIKYYSKSPDIFFLGLHRKRVSEKFDLGTKNKNFVGDKNFNQWLLFYFSHATDSFRRRRDEIKIINYLTF